MAWFSSSTQCKKWLFTPARLAQLRAATNARAGADPVATAASRKREGGPEPARLAVEDDLLLLRHWEHKLMEIGKKLELPSKVLATGTILLKRFYIYNSLTEHDPKHMMLTSLYLGTKVEEFNIDLMNFVTPFQVAPEVILKTELVLLAALKFELVVWHALKPMAALAQELKGRGVADSDAVRLQATAAFMALLTTDVPLLYSPSIVALACVRSLQLPATDGLIDERLAPQNPDVNLRVVTGEIVEQLKQASTPPDADLVRKADLKLKRLNKRAKPNLAVAEKSEKPAA